METDWVMQFFLALTERPEDNQPGSVPGDNDVPGMGCSVLKKGDMRSPVLRVQLSRGSGKSLVPGNH